MLAGSHDFCHETFLSKVARAKGIRVFIHYNQREEPEETLRAPLYNYRVRGAKAMFLATQNPAHPKIWEQANPKEKPHPYTALSKGRENAHNAPTAFHPHFQRLKDLRNCVTNNYTGLGASWERASKRRTRMTNTNTCTNHPNTAIPHTEAKAHEGRPTTLWGPNTAWHITEANSFNSPQNKINQQIYKRRGREGQLINEAHRFHVLSHNGKCISAQFVQSLNETNSTSREQCFIT